MGQMPRSTERISSHMINRCHHTQQPTLYASPVLVFVIVHCSVHCSHYRQAYDCSYDTRVTNRFVRRTVDKF